MLFGPSTPSPVKRVTFSSLDDDAPQAKKIQFAVLEDAEVKVRPKRGPGKKRPPVVRRKVEEKAQQLKNEIQPQPFEPEPHVQDINMREDDEVEAYHANALLHPVGQGRAAPAPFRPRGNSYAEFVDCVDLGVCAFLQIGEITFVVNPWTGGHQRGHDFYFLSRTFVEETMMITCTCPHANGISACFHERYLQEFGHERFPEIEVDGLPDETKPILFSRVEGAGNDMVNTFAVVDAGSRTKGIKGRVVVKHTGKDDGSGGWTCSKDRKALNCVHINVCRDKLKQLVTQNADAIDEEADRGNLVYIEPEAKKARIKKESVSYMRIPPPKWARVPSDPIYPDIPPPTSFPNAIPLGETATCPCSKDRQIVNRQLPVGLMRCKVFGFTSAWITEVEVQQCPKCVQGFIGPDCGTLGVFNWNNRTLFLHSVLDDYTASYTSSETPFTAWVSVIARRYDMYNSPIKFPCDTYFREIWFSYIRLMDFGGEFACPSCKDNPRVTIWDGVTVSFSRTSLLPTIAPPTTTDDTSPVRYQTAPLRQQQLITDGTLRGELKAFLDGPPIVLDMELLAMVQGNGGGERFNYEIASAELRRKVDRQVALMERFIKIPPLKARLDEVDPALGGFFQATYGEREGRQAGTTPEVYKDLFRQIAAEESVLQMINGRDMEKLRLFLQNQERHSTSTLVGIPSLYHVIKKEAYSGGLKEATKRLCQWLYVSSRTILTLLVQQQNDGTGADEVVEIIEDDWRKTGCYYSQRQLRRRPIYPRITNDAGQDAKSSTVVENCRKYYNTYGEKKLTGGLMVVWCTHSISYGFHCIPAAEGRNEVFSAMFTRWKQAPEVVIYDFACQLGPYCMVREPAFFFKTQFLIDTFHTENHTKCGKTSFLSTYSDTDPRLIAINSSAAECGNGSLKKIRKAVRYMGQTRAVVYTKVYLSVWNRMRIRKLYEKEKKNK